MQPSSSSPIYPTIRNRNRNMNNNNHNNCTGTAIDTNIDQDDPCTPISIPHPPPALPSTSAYFPVLTSMSMSMSRRRTQSWEGTLSPPPRSIPSPILSVLRKPRWDTRPSQKRVKYHHTFLILVSALILLFLARLDVPEDISMKYPVINNVNGNSGSGLKERHIASAPQNKNENETQGAKRDYQLAIFLQVSTPSLPLLPRLLSRLYHAENLYIVHFDTEINAEEGLHQLRLANVTGGWDLPSNVHILPQETVNYRGISMTLNTISGMSYALEHSSNWRYFINLSGADYPLVSPTELRRMLLDHTGGSREFFSFAPDDAAERMMKVRLRTFHVDDALGFLSKKNKVVSTGIENPLTEKLQLIPAFAEAWMIVSKEFAHYITHSAPARRALLTFSYSVSSPEHYFASLVRNSKFRNTIVNHSMRLVKWRYRGERAGQHPYYLDELYQREVDSGRKQQVHHDLVQSPLFFARKFKHTESKLMDDIDALANDPDHLKVVRDHFNGKLNYRNKKQQHLKSNAEKQTMTNGHQNNIG